MSAPREILLEHPDIKVTRRVMDNGEVRVDAECSGGSNFIRTKAIPGEPAWQNAHHHRHTSEFYAVVTGWMVVAERLGPDNFTVKAFLPGQWYMSRPGIDHNVLVKPGGDIDTLKFRVSKPGEGDKSSDWYDGDPTFSAWTKQLTIEMVLASINGPFLKLQEAIMVQ